MRKIKPSEHASQAAVIQWFSYARKKYGLPEAALFAIPNGGERNAIVGARLKAEGVRKGIPDLLLAVPKRTDLPTISVIHESGLFIEMKTRTRKPSTDQLAAMSYLRKAGYEVALCYSTDEAIQAITEYLK